MKRTDLGPARGTTCTTVACLLWRRRCQRIVRIAQRSELLDRRVMAKEIMAIYRIASGLPPVTRKGRRV